MCVCVNGNRVQCSMFNKLICKFLSAWPSHLARLASAISKWLCSFPFVIFLSCIYSKLYKFWARIKIVAKRSYYDRKFESAQKDRKLTWKLLNEVINKRKSKSPLPSSFKSEGGTITDPVEIANRHCKYFTNIGPNLASAIPAVNSSFLSFLTCNNNTAITLKPSTVRELENICSTFASGKAPGYDNIPIHVIKNSFHLISTPLMNIINLSFVKGIFPDKLKIAKVIPIYKVEDPCLFANYRPISLLTNFSNFFEKVMYNGLTECAETYEILYCCQFGFRKNHSTSLALIHLINKISSAIDRHEIPAGVFLDLS